MLKKHLLVSAIALGLSSVALANGSPIAAPVATATAASVSDFTPSVYVGLQGGMVDTGLKSSIFAEAVTIDKAYGIGGRAFVGYDFSKYFAVETGYMLDGQKTKFSFAGTELGKVRTQAFDLVGKIKAPIMDNFGLYAKLGPGYLMQKWSAAGQTSESHNKIDVVYGAGAYYTFASNWNVDLSWTRYNSGKSKPLAEKWQPNVDFYALGVSYKFNMPV